ncbi:hypothetical protein RFI_08864, partial [Reticulomyxa filosa]
KVKKNKNKKKKKKDIGPKLKTKLWKHQRITAKRVLRGVQKGKRGFADASAVGAGKTLSALASAVYLWQERHKNNQPNNGFLVLLPNINASVFELFDLTKKTIDGKIMPEESLFHQDNSILLTTLGRCRDHPLAKQWSLVIIDECTSVQNESALQTAEAWRQVVSSDCGVLMLSATFFRSRFTKLFYMIRMLGSCIPREGHYLNALLSEHIICHVPDKRRTWQIDYIGVPMPKKLREEYDEIQSNRRDLFDNKSLYLQLRQFISKKFEDIIIEEIAKEARQLVKAKRRPLIFANTKKEKEKIVDCLGMKPNSFENASCNSFVIIGHSSTQNNNKICSIIDGLKHCRVFTTHEAAYGLNMQHECDCIISRPQSGDLMEQMKGRIDRPGQKRDELILKILFADNTIEEAEASNIRMCGQFIRQYLDPLSETFANMVLEQGIQSIKKAFEHMLENENTNGRGRKNNRPTKKKQQKKQEKFESEQNESSGEEETTTKASKKKRKSQKEKKTKKTKTKKTKTKKTKTKSKEKTSSEKKKKKKSKKDT